MKSKERIAWALRHEHLWNDREKLLATIFAQKVYSPKLSNIDFVVDGLVQNARQIKKLTPTPGKPLKPKTDLVISQENFDDLIQSREVKDILLGVKHPVRAMDDASYTYLDYALFKRQKHGKVPSHIIDEINVIFSGGDIRFIY